MGFRITARRAIPLATVAAIGLAVPTALIGATPSASRTIESTSFTPVVLDEPQGLAFASRVISTEQRDDTLDPAEPTPAPLAKVVAPKGRAAAVAMPKPTPKPASKATASTGSGITFSGAGMTAARSRVVKIALAQLHDRYVSGGTGPDTFDCSGLVRYAYDQAGVGGKVGGGHSASAMLAWGRAAGLTSRTNGRAGDVVIYGNGSHAGIYIGGGKIISALNPSQGIRITGLNALGAPFTTFIHTHI